MPVLKNAARDLLTRAVNQLEGAGVDGSRGKKRKATGQGTTTAAAAIRGRSAVPQKRVYCKKKKKKKKKQTPKRTKQGGEGKKSKLFRFY
jgi:hypothetical protein